MHDMKTALEKLSAETDRLKFPLLQTEVEGKRAEILRYRKILPKKRKEEADMLYLPLADGNLLKIKYRVL